MLIKNKTRVTLPMSVSLSLVPKESVLNGLTLYEPVDLTLLERIIRCFKFLPGIKSGDNASQLEKYRDLANKSGCNMVSVSYVRKGLFGRFLPDKSLGLHSMNRRIRQTLSRERFIDIDIENAHPNLLFQACKMNNVPCPCLENLVTKRDECLRIVQTHYGGDRDSAKKLFLILMYGGSFKTWATEVGINRNKRSMTLNMVVKPG